MDEDLERRSPLQRVTYCRKQNDFGQIFVLICERNRIKCIGEWQGVAINRGALNF